MAFKEFTNRLVQYPNRRKLTLVAGTTDVYDITREEGTVFAEGVMFNEANMGEMQNAIEERFTPTKKTITWAGASVTPLTSLCYKIGDMVHVDFRMPLATPIAAGSVIGELPVDCRPSVSTGYIYGGVAFSVNPSDTTARSFSVVCSVQTNGQIVISSDIGFAMYNATVSFEFFVN